MGQRPMVRRRAASNCRFGQIAGVSQPPPYPASPNAVDDVSPSLRILIVEDHDDLADALRTNLRSEGYHASVARDGRQALAMVRADPPDIIVLDLGIPGLDGLALLARLRAEEIGRASCRARGSTAVSAD